MREITRINPTYSTTRTLTLQKPVIKKQVEDKFETFLFLPEGEARQGEGGLRTQGCFKKSFDDKPLISIVTVVYNGEAFLEETILSVINQAYDNVEYIIIDGGSTDRTIDIIKKYEDKLDYWISESDDGIYDAMNKGIDLVTGEWVNFVNSSDVLNGNAYTVILDCLVKNSNKCDVIAFGYPPVSGYMSAQ
jgi:cellulose synthase/poly-beta-1,6-N-acetylglucosamine synthase-like glycosyltransferase